MTQVQKRIERKQLALDYLGGECMICGSVDRLEFDHIDPLIKSKKINESYLLEINNLLAELDKCQLLCKPCHMKKSLRERGKREVAEHATASMYINQGCRCELCCAAHTQKVRLYRMRLRTASI